MAHLRRVRAELFKELLPRETQRRLEREGAIDEPEIQVEAERRPLQRLKGVHVERDRVRDDLVKKFFPESDRALPQRGRVRPRRVPPQFGAVCDEGMYQDLMFVG